MQPSQNFPEANCSFGTPEGLEESQCFTVKAYSGQVKNSQSSVDGAPIVVVAWKPTLEELEQLANRANIYISMLGGLAPHFLTTSFEQAMNPL